MEPFKTHGAFSWCELMTSDPQAATEFYGKLLGWSFDTMDMGMGPYRVVKAGDAAIGGVMGLPPGAGPMPPMWGCYVTVDDVDETVANCTALGGKVIMPQTEVAGVGRMAVLQDPQGAVFNVMTYASS
jgi:hypothetical protein